MRGRSRRAEPGGAGIAYHRTSGNAFVGADGRLDSWILQTPDCWGQRACTRPEGIPRFERTLERDLAGARTVVDLTTLIPFPFGAFRDAIVRGLRRAYAGGQRPVIRVLGGCAPPCAVSLPESPAQAYADQLAAAISGDARVIVAAYRFPPLGTPATLPSLSFNHSKTIAVDGRVALVGGHNLWGSDYVQGYPRSPLTNPVHDVTPRVEGPVSAGVHKWANTLWRAACVTARSTPPTAINGAAVAYGPGTPRTCPAAIRPPRAPRAGRVDVLGFGRLSLLGVRPPSGPTRPSGRGAPDDPSPCPTGLPFFTPATESPDWTNDRAYWPAFDRRDPAGTGLRALIRSARRRCSSPSRICTGSASRRSRASARASTGACSTPSRAGCWTASTCAW